MGLFSRKGRAANQANLKFTSTSSSIRSGHSTLRSPTTAFSFGSNSASHMSGAAVSPTGSLPFLARSPASPTSPTSSAPPASPFSAIILPKLDLPRPPDPQLDPAGYLRSLGAVRDRSKLIAAKALRNELLHFDVDMNKFADVVGFVARITKRDYEPPFTSIPPHGRYQHFCVGGRDRIQDLLNLMGDAVEKTEKCRRMVDLFLVSVLLDAGAGLQWAYKSRENNRIYRRSEGIAIASLEMFKMGLFSSDPANPYQVDKRRLQTLTVDQMAEAFQSRPGNEISGIDGRTSLLVRLGAALDEKRDFFGVDGRPGNIIDHLLSHPSTQASSVLIVPLPVLWNILMNGLISIWPTSRTSINGVSVGDAWPCRSMPQPTDPTEPAQPSSASASAGPLPGPAAWESILPFHKLTQWLCYSLMQPMQSLLNMHFAGVELLTGLPEYRNGGLFIDLGVLTLKRDDLDRGLQNYSDYCRRIGSNGVEVAPMFEPGDDVIVEWRGVTIGFLDRLCVDVNKALKKELGSHSISLAQLLEAGSWKGGREIAEVSRPNTKQAPILIDSDGTVF